MKGSAAASTPEESATGIPAEVQNVYEAKYGPPLDGKYCYLCKQNVRERGYVTQVRGG